VNFYRLYFFNIHMILHFWQPLKILLFTDRRNMLCDKKRLTPSMYLYFYFNKFLRANVFWIR
jgi:hypothetical protein